MQNDDNSELPVWTLTTRETTALPIEVGDRMTPQRLDELRTALAAFAEAPIATLEAHAMPAGVDRKAGMRLEAASPLATQLGLQTDQLFIFRNSFRRLSPYVRDGFRVVFVGAVLDLTRRVCTVVWRWVVRGIMINFRCGP